MRLAIMQPYLFPYIGYFQLIHAVDTFVIYDDVQYSKGGWINRNRIRLDGAAHWLTFPVQRASYRCAINERHYALDASARTALMRKLEAAYGESRARGEAMPVVEEVMEFTDGNVARFNANALRVLAGKLGLERTFIFCSDIGPPAGLKGEDRVVQLCHQLDASRYINAIGGLSLYDPDRFRAEGIELSFVSTTVEPVRLNNGSHQLSILDHMFHKGLAGTSALMTDYRLMTPGSDDARTVNPEQPANG